MGGGGIIWRRKYYIYIYIYIYIQIHRRFRNTTLYVDMRIITVVVDFLQNGNSPF
jgi:hypothetical protein